MHFTLSPRDSREITAYASNGPFYDAELYIPGTPCEMIRITYHCTVFKVLQFDIEEMVELRGIEPLTS